MADSTRMPKPYKSSREPPQEKNRRKVSEKVPEREKLIMSPISTLKLPLIDLSKLDCSKPGTGPWDSSQSEVRQALEEFGCFEALCDKMTLKLHNDVFQELERLFELPTDVKRRFDEPTKPLLGYLENLPLYEAFGIGDTPNSGSIERLADLMWPEGNTRFW
ncbi:probable 2-oxoglutarate-dependent dioxygenase AOP1.2 [Eucalyptus grandis]|uniref:probable 2-oxoglutarate-dependent dioxygenase AOP1.2 n=1 Tax=Eucalyptus grandis TaxID=71139 RepID=UPI0005244D57|nr:probable 2-oxoglutarate-dependent dioxygenase AOP1.2 [Eucalyptus grandis]